jgi:gliding motility-associated-like protein
MKQLKFVWFILWIILCSIFITTTVNAQCDVAISSWDAVSGDIVIEAINSENCGCNEFTTEENTCENSGSSYVNNNETISHIVLGLHVEGLDYNWGCTGAVNHPGWTFKAFTLFGNQVLESGDTWSANVYDTSVASDCWAEILSNDTLCSELVVWQINLSQTATTDNGGWAVNPNVAAQTQNYPDVDLSNNTAIYCAPLSCDTVYVDVEIIEYLTDTFWLTDYIYLPGDTIVLIDTAIVVEYIYEVDTLIEYVQLPADTVQVIEYVNVVEYVYDTIILIETDTLVEFEYIYLTDTLYVETVVYEYLYVYNTDTITEFVAESVYIDCNTGEECSQIFPCDEVSIFAPNAVTPNGDGINDTWMVLADGECWGQWEVRIYNRWGGLVWISASSTDEWDADVATGTYVYTITAHSSMNANVFQFNGTITVLY